MKKLIHKIILAAALPTGMLLSDPALAGTRYVVSFILPAMNTSACWDNSFDLNVGLNDLGWMAIGRNVHNMTGPGSVTPISNSISTAGSYVCARDINNSGQVTGYIFSIGAVESIHSAFITGNKVTGSTLLVPADYFSDGILINAAGQVVIHSYPGGVANEYGMVTGPGGAGIAYKPQPLAPAGITGVTGINNHSQYIYSTNASIAATTHYFFTGYNGIGQTEFLANGLPAIPKAINDLGQIVGQDSTGSVFVTGIYGIGSHYIDGSGALGIKNKIPLGLNNAGQVVGAVLYPNGSIAFATGPNGTGITDLNTVTTLPAGVTLMSANRINNAGQILATTSNLDVYLLSPVVTADPDKNNGCTCDAVSTPFPINAGTGNKYFSDTDYTAVHAGDLQFQRQYNSQDNVSGGLGTAWRHNYSSAINPNAAANGVQVVSVTRSNGTATRFIANAGVYTPQDADVKDKLVQLSGASGWTYTVAADDSVETYDANGKLQSIKARSGQVQTLTYSTTATPTSVAPAAGLLLTVTDAFGHQLHFTYDGNARIHTIADPSGALYTYAYDGNNNLASVTYPDNSTKTYLYGESANGAATSPNALTGILDENGQRYANYYYDNQGRAYAENHGGAVDQYQITYGSGGSTSVTDPLGAVRVHNLQTVLGVVKSSGSSQPAGAGSAAASSSNTYDANGNLARYTDFKGNQTTYAYDMVRNLQISRTEAAGTAQARTITTQWHPTFRLPTAIAAPLRMTTLTYDTSGNLLSKTERATTDATGAQAMTPTLTGTPRTWKYTYNTQGQRLTAVGPRTDVVDLTRYGYDAANGNLLSVTNAANQVTIFSNYDADGRVGRLTDANGATTDLTYTPRGWLHTRVVTAGTVIQTTSYDYDHIGQLTTVHLPDGSSLGYTYDSAHRLTAVTDNLGNAIHYTLDPMGNRIAEQTSDTGGVLTRQIARVYDSLNRLSQVTGAAQ